MNLCIVQPRELNQRGSFIDYQIQFLSPVLEIYNGWYPSNSTISNIFSKFPLTNLIIRGIVKRLLPLQFHKLYSREVSKLLVKNNISCGLIEYGPTAGNLADAFKMAGIPYHALTNYQTLIDLAVEKGIVAAAEQNTLLNWRADPANWQG